MVGRNNLNDTDVACCRYVSVAQGTVAVARASKDETNVPKHVACFV